MNVQVQTTNAIPKTVVTHPAHPGINSKSQQRFASKVLAMNSVLQTTLEINELFALYAKESGKFVQFDGLSYHFPELKVDIKLGQQEGNRCAYQLVASDDQLGELVYFRKYPFKEKELNTIENLLSGLLFPLRNALLYQRALWNAVMDPVTGTKNRATMDSTLKREVELAHRQETQLSVLLMDIDFFKHVNDTYGHQQGDQTLREVAQSAAETIRSSDMLFRYGGEEFLIILSGTDLTGAQLLAERIRKNIEILHPCPNNKPQVTVSLGAVCLLDNEAPEDLVNRVDNALYDAKNGGRNQVATG